MLGRERKYIEKMEGRGEREKMEGGREKENGGR